MPISWPWAAAKNRDSIRYIEYLIREGGSKKKIVTLLHLLMQSEKLQLVLEGKTF